MGAQNSKKDSLKILFPSERTNRMRRSSYPESNPNPIKSEPVQPQAIKNHAVNPPIAYSQLPIESQPTATPAHLNPIIPLQQEQAARNPKVNANPALITQHGRPAHVPVPMEHSPLMQHQHHLPPYPSRPVDFPPRPLKPPIQNIQHNPNIYKEIERGEKTHQAPYHNDQDSITMSKSQSLEPQERRKLVIRGLKRYKESRCSSVPPTWVKEFPCRSRYHPDNYIYDFQEGPNIPKRSTDAMNKCSKKGGRCERCGIYTGDICLKCRRCETDCECINRHGDCIFNPNDPRGGPAWRQAENFLSEMNRFPSQEPNKSPAQYPFNTNSGILGKASGFPGAPPPPSYFPQSPGPPALNPIYPPPGYPPYHQFPPYGYPYPLNYGAFPQGYYPIPYQYPPGPPVMPYGYPTPPGYGYDMMGMCDIAPASCSPPSPSAPIYNSYISVNNDDQSDLHKL